MEQCRKFRYAGIFVIIAKITVHIENFNFLYACNFCYDSEISLCSENYCAQRNSNFCYACNFAYIAKLSSPLFVFKQLRFGFSPFYHHCNFVVSYCFVISLFLRIYKPQSVTNRHQSLHNKFLGKLSAPVFPLFSLSLHFLSFSRLPNTPLRMTTQRMFV